LELSLAMVGLELEGVDSLAGLVRRLEGLGKAAEETTDLAARRRVRPCATETLVGLCDAPGRAGLGTAEGREIALAG